MSSPYISQNAVTARNADLSKALKSLGVDLESDSSNGWRVPGFGGLIIWKKDNEIWRWIQHSAGEHGDSISFLTKFHSMSRKEAINTLLPYSDSNSASDNTLCIQSNKGCVPSGKIIKSKHSPTRRWQKIMKKIVRHSALQLQDNRDLQVRESLRCRGLREETIKKAKLGWISKDRWADRKRFDLPEEHRENGKLKKMWFPSGLYIPHIDSKKNVTCMRVRRVTQKNPRYYTFPGSCIKPLVLGTVKSPIIICESDLDAWLIYQEVGDGIAVASLGSSGGKPDPVLGIYLLAAPQILISLDNDDAGRKATRWWSKYFPESKSWPVPWGKDPGEAFSSAPNLIREWIKEGLSKGRD